MTLSAQILLIDSIVKKDPDFTIRDYLELVKEMDSISGTIDVPLERESKMNEWVEEPAPIDYYSWKRLKQKKYLRTYKIGS